MPANGQKAQALIRIMQRQYEAIRTIETNYQIMGQEGDYRPRIEYYHDAVRALTNEEEDGGKHSRLSVERLSYDVSMLRHIQAKPLTSGRSQAHLSPSAEVSDPATAARIKRPPREIRHELATLYKDYGVLFAALFAESADQNARDREEEIDQLLEECHHMQQGLEHYQQQMIDKAQLIAQANQLENDDLHVAMQAVLQTKQQLDAKKLQQAMQALQGLEGRMQTELQTVQDASTRFALDQLAVYEHSKETIKRLNAQGMNVAGKFVEQSMQQGHGQGRGV